MLIIDVVEDGVSTHAKKDPVKENPGGGGGGCVVVACCVSCSNDD